MIYVDYKYWKKSEKRFIKATKVFTDCVKAKRFMWSLRYKNAFILGYRCDDSEDNEWLDQNVSLYQINYGN